MAPMMCYECTMTTMNAMITMMKTRFCWCRLDQGARLPLNETGASCMEVQMQVLAGRLYAWAETSRMRRRGRGCIKATWSRRRDQARWHVDVDWWPVCLKEAAARTRQAIDRRTGKSGFEFGRASGFPESHDWQVHFGPFRSHMYIG